MSRHKKGPTPRRVHRADSQLEARYLALYEEVGRANVELAELRERLRIAEGSGRR